MPNLKLITFGCQTNQLDSEKIAGMLSREGFLLTEQEEKADLIILNTCSIRQKAEEKFFSQLGRVGVLKRRKPLLEVGVCGCIAEQEGKGLRLRFPFVDFVVGTNQIAQIPSLLREKGNSAEEKEPVVPLRFNRFKAWVEIMKGCDNFCAYCVVPYLRGREESRPPEEILQEIGGLVSSGYNEIILLGHNVDSYGKGLQPRIDFAQLLRSIQEKVSASVWVRFTTSHPKDLTGEVGRCIAELPSLCHHVHLPVQSGSDRVLAGMNRGYSSQDFLRIVDELRGWVPDIAISTDIMVGFPGETEEDFQETLHLLEKARFDRIFSFKYSPRSKTSALAYPGHLPETVKEQRLHEVIILQNRISLEKNQAMLGEVWEVRVENKESKKAANLVTARTRTNHVVHFADPEAEEGSLRRVRITQANPFHVKGEAIH
jgi:tRNA-2-methylthio-N6-dimethylallyladenosine synthase